MDERMRFVAKLLDGETMTDVCLEFGISRKTGYKIFSRYKEQGPEALNDRSRRPVRYANQLPAQIEGFIVTFKQEKPSWGARKIRELLVRRLPSGFATVSGWRRAAYWADHGRSFPDGGFVPGGGSVGSVEIGGSSLGLSGSLFFVEVPDGPPIRFPFAFSF